MFAASESSFDLNDEFLHIDGDRNGGREWLRPRVEHQHRHIPSRNGILSNAPSLILSVPMITRLYIA